jgi:pimeloyl-ACP methyl ester carboxylesterase
MATLYFAHGKESGPWGSKIRHLSEVAIKQGHSAQSPDYSVIANPDDRVNHLLDIIDKEQNKNDLILVGSSMGGYVSTVVSSIHKVKGLFLMAPALYMPDYKVQSYSDINCPVSIVHGWSDEVIPFENSLRFAKQGKHALHLINSDHRLSDQLEDVGQILGQFLSHLDNQ